MGIANFEELFVQNNENENFGLIIEGLGLLFEKNGKWRIWFPNSWDHLLKVSVFEGLEELRPIEGIPPMTLEAGSEISIKHKGATPFSESPEFGNSILNIGDLHNRIRLNRKGLLKKHGSVLDLKDTKLNPIEQTNKNFNLYKYILRDGETEAEREDLGVRTYATVIGGAIEIKTEKEAWTKLKIKGNVDFEEKLPYTQNGAEKYTIKISNHCNRPACDYQSDFNLYYKLFDKTSLENVEYDLEYLYSENFDNKRGAKAPCNVIYSTIDPEV